MHRFSPAAFILLAAVATPAQSAPAPGNYSYVAFAVPGATGGTVGVAINASGAIAGNYYVAEMLQTLRYGFIRAPDGTLTTISPEGSSITTVTGLADDGTVIGNYEGPDGFNAGFTFKNGQYQTFQQPATYTTLRAISPNGIVVGDTLPQTASANTQYFFYKGSVKVKTVPNTLAFSAAVNSAGNVVGCYYHSSVGPMPYLVQSGSFTGLPFVPGKPSCPTAINDSGVIVGPDFESEEVTKAFVVNDGKTQTFQYPGATRTSATGINDAGVIIGAAAIPPSRIVGYVLKSGVLNTLITSDGEDVFPNAINKAGQIVGESSSSTVIATPR